MCEQLKRILLVGSDKEYAIENNYREAFPHKYVVKIHPIQRFFEDQYSASLCNKILFKLNKNNFLKPFNYELIKAVEEFKPDVVLVFKGMTVFPETIIAIKKIVERVYCYNADHPFIFDYAGSGNKYVRESICLYDAYFTYSASIKRELVSRFNVKSLILPFAISSLPAIRPEPTTIISRVCFIGNPDKERAIVIKHLLKQQLPVTVYGINWNAFLKPNALLEILPPLSQTELIQQIPAYKVQLNLFRNHNMNSHNMRSIEIPAFGGVQLAPRSEDHDRFFGDREFIFYYSDLASMTKIAKNLLNLSCEEICQLQESATKYILQNGFTYKDRVSVLLDHFEL